MARSAQILAALLIDYMFWFCIASALGQGRSISRPTGGVGGRLMQPILDMVLRNQNVL